MTPGRAERRQIRPPELRLMLSGAPAGGRARGLNEASGGGGFASMIRF